MSRNAFEQAAVLVRDVASGLRSGGSLHMAMAIEAGATTIATADRNLAQNAKANGLAAERF